MDDGQLDEIEQRCRRATPGPWKSWIEGRDMTAADSFIATGGEDIYLRGATEADQDFIAAARQDVQSLVDEVRRLRREVPELPD
jgi:hypothetical protein